MMLRRTRRLVAAAALAAVLAACNVHSLYGPGREFDEQVARGDWAAAAEIYAANKAFFQESRESFAPQLALVAQGLNARLEPQLARAIARAKSVEWPVPPDGWNDIKGQLKSADTLLRAYNSHALLQDPALRSNKVEALSTTLYLLNGQIRESAAAAFAAYDHFSGTSFFDAYPLTIQPARFMSAHYGRIKTDVERANTLELGRFLDSYAMGRVLRADVALHAREAYVDALTAERTGGRDPDMLDAWEVLGEVKAKGIDVKRITRDRFAVLEVASRNRMREEGVAFPLKVKADIAFTVHTVSLEKALADAAAAKADYLIVVDLAASEATQEPAGNTTVPSRHYSHSTYSANPAYHQAQMELQQAQSTLQAALRSDAGDYDVPNNSSEEAALAGLFVNVIGIAVKSSRISDAEDAVAEAQEKLNNTPPQLEQRQYARYEFTRAGVEGTKTYAVNYFVIDRKTGKYVRGRFDGTEKRTFTLLKGLRDADPEKARHRTNTHTPDDIQDWLEQTVLLKVSEIVEDYRKRRKAAEKLPPMALVQQDLYERRNSQLALATGGEAAPVMAAVAPDTTALGFGHAAEFDFPVGDPRPGGYAVVIGVRDYRDKDVPRVSYALNDADAVRQFLVKTKGFAPDNVVVLNNPNQSDLMAYFGTENDARGKLFDTVRREKLDEVFVFFSGHGVPTDDGAGVLLASDADPLKPGLTGYRLETLVRNLNKLTDVKVTLAVDSCFSGLSHGGTLIKAASPVFLAARPEKTGLSNGVVFTAADGREIASWDERLRLGLFTRVWLEGMVGKADRVSGNGDGRVEVFEMESFLKSHVGREANRRFSRQQTPQVVGVPSAVVNDRTDPDFEALEEILALAR